MSSPYLLKQPQQARSRATVDALVEAAEQILVEEGWEGLTTNRVAERAGASVGTLYQYFANKEAIVGLVTERFLDDQLELLRERLLQIMSGGEQALEQVIPPMVHALVEIKEIRPRLSRVLFDQIPSGGQIEALSYWNARAIPMIVAALKARREEVRAIDLELGAHVLVNAVHGIIHATILDRPELLGGEGLGDEIAALVVRYLRP